MIHLLLIFIVASTLGRDGLPGVPLLNPGPAVVWAGTLVPQLAICVVTCAIIVRSGRRLERKGAWSAVSHAELALSASQWLAAITHAVSVFLLGWLDEVRRLIGGNYVLLDEALTMIPPLATLLIGWAAYFGIDRRLHEATVGRALHSGESLPSLVTRLQYTLDQVRHHMLLVLVPIGLISAWGETVSWVVDRRYPRAGEGEMPDWVALAATAAEVAGVAAVLIFMPILIRRLWSTVALGDGPLRDRLLSLCRAQGVSCRELLVWRTHGRMLNGAVIGIIPRWRYILLTDALLESLAPEQLEAVMAHEVAHARRHHLPWLMVTMAVTLSLVWAGGATIAEAFMPPETTEPRLLAWLAAVLALTVTAGVLVFGWVSRLFERQADAFAVQHLSGVNRSTQSRSDLVIDEEAALAMAGALGAVAAHNHIMPDRFSWRHGSIAQRQRRIRRLVGLPAARLPVDAVVGRLKLAALVGLAATIALALWENSGGS